ncbi:MAG: sulfotransferase [Pseudomonadota bacterium]
MIFVVGNSRSGTTMLARAFGLNPKVHKFEELHFFEQQIDTAALKENKEWPDQKLMKLGNRLFTTANEGLFTPARAGKYDCDTRSCLEKLKRRTPLDLYRSILELETARAGKTVPLEQTPRYIFYGHEILTAFPDSHMINIIRDPRDALLSQKNRWRRGKLTEDHVPLIWTLRSWSNYHPVTTSKLWNSAVRAADSLDDHPRFHSVSYEGLLRQPEQVLRDLCNAIGLSFHPEMLGVAQIGSSTGSDRPERRGFDKSRIGAWQRGNLTPAELAVCEEITYHNMRRHGYEPGNPPANSLSKFILKLSAPLKLALAGVLNLNRFRNLPEIIRRRFG